MIIITKENLVCLELKNLNINEEELPFYLKDYTFDDLESPNNFHNVDIAASRILDAIKKG